MSNFIIFNQTFLDDSPSKSLPILNETLEKNISIITWIGKLYRGLQLPRSLNKDHMKYYIHALVVLLQRVKGFVKAYLFEDWMYG